MQKTKLKSLLADIDNTTFSETLEYIEKFSKKSDKKTFVVTVNTEILMIARKDSEYEKVIKSADLALPESIGVMWGGRMMGIPFKERIPGVDLMEKLIEKVSKQPITVGFIGGKQNVAELTAERLSEMYPGLKVAFAKEEWDSPEAKLDCDILFVAFGSPKQENWIHKNLNDLNVNVAIGVGGAFDFISGRVPRAPKLIRDLGFEWLFRLIIQPWRIKRQLALIHYVIVILKEKITR